jgi:predicted outer membrane protein
MLRRTLLLAAIPAALFVAPRGEALAQSRIIPDPTPRLPAQEGQGLSAEDARSLQRAARLSDAQIEAGRLGAEKAGSAEVKQLATSIAEEHARLRQTLGNLATEHRVELQGRDAAGIEDRSLATLRQASGEAFDRAFLARQLGLYRIMARLYQTMASNSPDPALQRLGITALAALRAHFETARTLGARFGLSADTIENPPQY